MVNFLTTVQSLKYESHSTCPRHQIKLKLNSLLHSLLASLFKSQFLYFFFFFFLLYTSQLPTINQDCLLIFFSLSAAINYDCLLIYSHFCGSPLRLFAIFFSFLWQFIRIICHSFFTFTAVY